MRHQKTGRPKAHYPTGKPPVWEPEPERDLAWQKAQGIHGSTRLAQRRARRIAGRTGEIEARLGVQFLREPAELLIDELDGFGLVEWPVK